MSLDGPTQAEIDAAVEEFMAAVREMAEWMKQHVPILALLGEGGSAKAVLQQLFAATANLEEVNARATAHREG